MVDSSVLKTRLSIRKSGISFNSIAAFLINNYYLFFILMYGIGIFIDIRPAVILFAYNIVVFLMLLFGNQLNFSFLSIIPFAFLFSFVAYASNGIPFSVFFSSAIYVISPMVYCAAAKQLKVDIKKFFRNFVIAIIANDIIGAICFYLKPAFYITFLRRASETALAQVEHISGSGRLVTIFGSIETGALSAICFIVCLGMIIAKTEKKKGFVFALLISSVAVILTQQRGPIFTCILVVIFIIFYSFKKQLLKPRVIFLILLAAIVTLYILSQLKPTVFSWIIERLLNPTDALTERTDYQFDVLVRNNSILNWLFGTGLGSHEIFAYDIVGGKNVILDQMYFNIFGEVGLVGLVLFVLLLARCLIKGLKNIKDLFIPFFIVFTVSFIGLGTTLTYYPQIMPIFWFSVGMIYYQKSVLKGDS